MENSVLYFFVVCTVLSLTHPRSRKGTPYLAIIALFGALLTHQASWQGALALTFYAFLCWWNGRSYISPIQRTISLFLVISGGIAFTLHWIPGFCNPALFDNYSFSPDSKPFTSYFSFEKTMMAILIVIFIKDVLPSFSFRTNYVLVGRIVLACATLLLFLGCMTHFIVFSPKIPTLTWLWMLNNLVFVCFSEEVLFRGVIQNQLSKIMISFPLPNVIPIVLSSLIFGLVHYRGGIIYIALSTIAGLFYGYIYNKTKRLESSIQVHFGLNCLHFILFTYPAAIR